jgi:hypothetical protein
VKLNVKDKKQLEFDLRFADYLVGNNFAFESVASKKTHHFFEWVSPQFHIKHPTTFTR